MSEAMLVFYDRPDSAGVKLSEYQCVSVVQPEDLKVQVPACVDMLMLKCFVSVVWHEEFPSVFAAVFG